MGGSGGREYVPTAPSSPCSRLAFRATLNSPQAAILGTLQIGSILNVVPVGQGVNATFNGEAAGAITGSQIAQLLKCIKMGFSFEAVVVQITGGQCVVDVKPR